jgi:hypothetical protein
MMSFLGGCFADSCFFFDIGYPAKGFIEIQNYETP